MSSCGAFSAAPVERGGTLLGGMRGCHIGGLAHQCYIQPPVVTGFTKCGPLKLLSSSSLAVSEELPSPCPVQTLEEGRVLSEHPLVKGECHMCCSCDSCC